MAKRVVGAVGRITALLWSLLLFPGIAWGQCSDCSEGCQRYGEQYVPNATGKYRLIFNRQGPVGSRHFNFAVETGGIRHTIPMADPTIMCLENSEGQRWYYVTGTSDACRTANFAIYKSQDLVNWLPHMLAFSESSGERRKLDTPSCAQVADANCYKPSAVSASLMLNGPFTSVPTGDYAIKINTRVVNGVAKDRIFTQLWAPQLYIDPMNCDQVYLTFTAKEIFEGQAGQTYPFSTTLFVTSVSKSGFESGQHFAGSSVDPELYGYVNGGLQVDGGLSRSVPTPCSVDMIKQVDFAQPGNPGSGYNLKRFYANAMEWLNPAMIEGGSTVLDLDGFVYFDELDGMKKWMFYRWQTFRWQPGTEPGLSYNGCHVAAYQMFNNRRMGTGLAAAVIPIAYRFSSSNPVDAIAGSSCHSTLLGAGKLLNGIVGFDSLPIDWPAVQPGCVGNVATVYGCAEGPAAFSRDGQNYVMFSRNSAFSSAYGIYYRHAGKKIGLMGLNSFTDYSTPEKVLIQSAVRNKPGGRSFGHGEVFRGPTAVGAVNQRYYLIYHAKRDESSFATNEPDRTVFFKDLRFSGKGTITALSDDGNDAVDTISLSDSDCFLVPWCDATDPARPVPPCSVQQASSGDTEGLFSFLSQWFSSEASADLNNDGLVDANDVIAYLSK